MRWCHQENEAAPAMCKRAAASPNPLYVPHTFWLTFGYFVDTIVDYSKIYKLFAIRFPFRFNLAQASKPKYRDQQHRQTDREREFLSRWIW